MPREALRLTLYTRSNCPLCDEAKAVLSRVQSELGGRLAFDVVDIERDERLIKLYGELIPVVAYGDETLFVGKVSAHRLKEMVRGPGGPKAAMRPGYWTYLERVKERLRRVRTGRGDHAPPSTSDECP